MLKITRLREGRGWSKLELSRRTKISPADITRIEQGRFIPYPGQLRRLAKVFGISGSEAACLLKDDNQLAPKGEL